MTEKNGSKIDHVICIICIKIIEKTAAKKKEAAKKEEAAKIDRAICIID